MNNTEPVPARLFGHQRIFQQLYLDLNMRHEIVTLEDGTKRYAYLYDGVDPYELEDSHFPKFAKAVERICTSERLDELEHCCECGYWHDSDPTSLAMTITERKSLLQTQLEGETK